MRIGFNFIVSPAGIFAAPTIVRPSSLAARSTTGFAKVEAGTQIVPVPRPRPSTVTFVFQPKHLGVGLEQPVDEDECVVLFMAHEIAGGLGRSADLRDRRLLHFKANRLERPIKCLEDPIDLHAHLRAIVQPVISYGRFGGPPG